MTFKIRYRKRFFWNTEIITAFALDKEMDRLQLFYEDGSLLEIAEWSKYDCKLGKDYFDFIEKRKEQKVGQE